MHESPAINHRSHWEDVYATRPPNELGWYAPRLSTSLEWIEGLELDRDAPIIDAGAGLSTLADDLLAAGYRRITVLDIAQSALDGLRARVGAQAGRVTWLNADVTSVRLPRHHYALWHDRAVFHFLTAADERRRYIDCLYRALQPGGHVIMAAFTPAAPPRCSGLPVRRYTAGALADELGGRFSLRRSAEETHVTPGGVEQRYVYCEFVAG